ncbi:DNA cytosine methyltransferase [Helicobacter pylori]|nr:DNA cytosine methyltransferase [Helicobacter pylori]
MLLNQTLTYISLFSGAGVGCYGLLGYRNYDRAKFEWRL